MCSYADPESRNHPNKEVILHKELKGNVLGQRQRYEPKLISETSITPNELLAKNAASVLLQRSLVGG